MIIKFGGSERAAQGQTANWSDQAEHPSVSACGSTTLGAKER